MRGAQTSEGIDLKLLVWVQGPRFCLLRLERLQHIVTGHSTGAPSWGRWWIRGWWGGGDPSREPVGRRPPQTFPRELRKVGPRMSLFKLALVRGARARVGLPWRSGHPDVTRWVRRWPSFEMPPATIVRLIAIILFCPWTEMSWSAPLASLAAFSEISMVINIFSFELCLENEDQHCSPIPPKIQDGL